MNKRDFYRQILISRVFIISLVSRYGELKERSAWKKWKNNKNDKEQVAKTGTLNKESQQKL